MPSAHRKVGQYAACCAVARAREILPKEKTDSPKRPSGFLMCACAGTAVPAHPLSHTATVLGSPAAPSCRRSSQLGSLAACALMEGGRFCDPHLSSSSLPPVVGNSALTAGGLRESWSVPGRLAFPVQGRGYPHPCWIKAFPVLPV